ncbi:hypothetical protein AgCh_015593 [Apium graveolens]
MYDAHDDDFEDCEDFDEEPNAKAKEFNEMVNTASEPIYPNNANFTTLEFVMELLRWKNRHNCSNNGFDDLLHLIGLVFPNDHKLPEKYYTVRKMIRGLNMEYEKIDACENDCMLFYKEHSEKNKCDICKRDRYKVQKDPKNRRSRTISDFPALTMLSGWSTKGKLAYPVCMGEVKAKQLKHGGFFDPMEHLPLHLATECKLGGPANGRWMYFVERYLHNLKLKVENKARAEGSMLRRNEAPRKFHDVELLEVYTYMTHPSLQSRDRILNGDEHELVAYYVLINSPEVGKYLQMFENDYSIHHDDEEENKNDKEAEDEDEKNGTENDEFSDDDDLV